jgi:hypothetical protein
MLAMRSWPILAPFTTCEGTGSFFEISFGMRFSSFITILLDFGLILGFKSAGTSYLGFTAIVFGAPKGFLSSFSGLLSFFA